MVFISGELRCVLEFLLGNVGPVAFERSVVLELAPRNCILVCAMFNEVVKFHDRIENLPSNLGDHQPRDPTDLLAVEIKDRCSFDTVALISGLSHRVLLARLGHFSAGFAVEIAAIDARVLGRLKGISFVAAGLDLTFPPAAAGDEALTIAAASEAAAHPAVLPKARR